jgi:hypothetical protein
MTKSEMKGHCNTRPERVLPPHRLDSVLDSGEDLS